MSPQEAALFVGVSASEPLLPALIEVATALVDDKLSDAGRDRIPQPVYEVAVKLVIRRLFEIQRSSKGVVQYGADGEVTFLPADALKPALPMLAPYAGLGAVG